VPAAIRDDDTSINPRSEQRGRKERRRGWEGMERERETRIFESIVLRQGRQVRAWRLT
jgi:hypothetical protein